MPTLNSIVNVTSEDDSNYLAQTIIDYKEITLQSNVTTSLSLYDGAGEVNNLYFNLAPETVIMLGIDNNICQIATSSATISLYYAGNHYQSFFAGASTTVGLAYIKPTDGTLGVSTGTIRPYKYKPNMYETIKTAGLYLLLGNLKFKKNFSIIAYAYNSAKIQYSSVVTYKSS